MNPGFVYIIHDPAVLARVKIGRSVDPACRLKELNRETGNAGALELVFSLECDDMKDIEFEMHNHFRGSRMRNPSYAHNEWFTVTAIEAAAELRKYKPLFHANEGPDDLEIELAIARKELDKFMDDPTIDWSKQPTISAPMVRVDELLLKIERNKSRG